MTTTSVLVVRGLYWWSTAVGVISAVMLVGLGRADWMCLFASGFLIVLGVAADRFNNSFRARQLSDALAYAAHTHNKDFQTQRRELAMRLYCLAEPPARQWVHNIHSARILMEEALVALTGRFAQIVAKLDATMETSRRVVGLDPN